MNCLEEISIHTESINLDQLLKWAGVVETGGQVKLMLEESLITLNGVIVNERRKKIRPGDIVKVQGFGEWKVVEE